MTTTELLTASRAAHLRYQNAKTDLDLAEAAILDAQDLRITADKQDPEHTDPAWDRDRYNIQGVALRHPLKTNSEVARAQHDALLAFYAAWMVELPNKPNKLSAKEMKDRVKVPKGEVEDSLAFQQLTKEQESIAPAENGDKA